jgi:hypothetical protein
MPTLSKAQLVESESPWGAGFDRMYLELCRDRIPILTKLKFYAKHDLPPPLENSKAILTKDEEEELRQIASALTVAAAASATMPTGVLAATLLKVSKKPSLLLTRELPAPVEWAIACDYQRGDEPPRTHWRDVWGDQVARFPGEVEQPTEANIAKAAFAALATIQESRKPGRTYNRADQILADRLGEIFRGSGQPIRRCQQPVMRDGEAVYIEGGGPFYKFLELALKPLQRYLRERGLAPVTVATIVRLVTADFPPA